MHDVFISHASEDKEAIGRPLAAELRNRGLYVWFDEDTLTVGDSKRRKIDRGLRDSRYAVVILSASYIKKEWPNRELDGLVTIDGGQRKFILPVWHDVSQEQIEKYSPTLADKVGVTSAAGVEHVADEILRAINEEQQVETPIASKTLDFLSSLRATVLTSANVEQLKRCHHEIKIYLNDHPTDVEARLLKDTIEQAIAFEVDRNPCRRKRLLFTSSAVSMLLILVLIGVFRFVIPGGPIYMAASRHRDSAVINATPTSQIQIRLSWVSEHDLDLSLDSPSGERTWYNNRITTGSKLDQDVLVGPGREAITISNLKPGNYQVVVDNNSATGSPRFELELIVNDKLVRVYEGTIDEEEQQYVLDLVINQ